MDLATEPDIYEPIVDENGNYKDLVPSFLKLPSGLRCVCGARKDKVYKNGTIFSNHIKTKCHQKWLENLNLNKMNYYVDNIRLKDTLYNQKLIIGNLEKELKNKDLTINYLTHQLDRLNNSKCIIDKNLIDKNLIDI